jgi:hypothetical protein
MQKFLHILKIGVKMMEELEPPVFHHAGKTRLNRQAVYKGDRLKMKYA